MDPNYFSYGSDHGSRDSFQNLSESDYAKVIFCDLYYNTDSTVGCRFQITDHVHEDPCDYIGLFRVGYDNLSQCLASKMLSKTDCEEDGKLLRCTFKPSELPELENGFYQFLYVTRDNEVCGASMPFEVKNSMKKDFCSDDDIVADSTEDDFMLVRSNMAEKNRRLQELLDEMTQKLLFHEIQMRGVQQKLKIVNEEKLKLENLLKKACEEKETLFNEAQKVAEEKNVICKEKEEAIRILKEKNKVFSSMFDNYSEKLKEFTELKDALEADKDLAVAENLKLIDRIAMLTAELQAEKDLLKDEQVKHADLCFTMKKETTLLYNQLDDLQRMIEVMEKSKNHYRKDLSSVNDKTVKLQEKIRDVKCENLALSTRLSETVLALEKVKEEKDNVMSELMALKLHVIEMHESRQKSRISSGKETSVGSNGISLSDNKSPNSAKKCTCGHEHYAFHEIIVPLEACSAVIGNSGSMVKMITQNTGASLQFTCNDKKLPGSKFCKIIGTARQVNHATSMIEDIIQNVKEDSGTALLSEDVKAVKMLHDDLHAEINKKTGTFEKEDFDITLLSEEVKAMKMLHDDLHAEINKKIGTFEKEDCDTTLLSEEVKAMQMFHDDLHAEINKKIGTFEKESTNTERHEELKALKMLCDEKDATIEKLKEELVKANGVVEYLTKERESLQNNESFKQKALDECILRLNEASELYKKQFRKIKKLQKKLNKGTEDFMETSTNMSQKDSCSMIDSADEIVIPALQLPQNQNSDSDTGEHVVGQHTQIGKMENTAACKIESVVSQQSSISSAASCSKASTPEIREVPGLQTLIEMNLEKLKHSKSKDDTDGMFSIPCPVCDEDVGIHTSSSDEMIKHLEMQHKQQLCPVCGRLFDMTLPAKYFIFHVEDHFKANKK